MGAVWSGMCAVWSGMCNPILRLLQLNFFGQPLNRRQPDVESGLLKPNKKGLLESTMHDLKHMEVQLLRTVHVKNVNFKCSTPPIELEWCGVLYSGKIGSLSYENSHLSDEQLWKNQTPMTQDPDLCDKHVQNQQPIGYNATYSDIDNYNIDQLQQMLTATKVETEHLINLKNENIITFIGIYFEENKLPIIVMESVQCDLQEYLDNNKIVSWDNSFNILQGISNALLYLHEVKNVVHHNLSMKTVVLTKCFVAKLISFESATALPSDATAMEKNNLKSDDIFHFGEVLINVISCTQHKKEHLQSLFNDMHQFADVCLSRKNSPSASSVVTTIGVHRHQYETNRDDNHSDISTDSPERLTKENEQLKVQVENLELKLLQVEETKFKLTNAFTTIDSRSPFKISEEYRHIQHHDRSAAARAHRKLYSNYGSVPFHEHTMIAYNKAKELILIASKQYIEKSMFDLQCHSDESHDTNGEDEDFKSIKLMMDKFYDDHRLTSEPVGAIEKTLLKEYKSHVNQQDVPTEVIDYYTKLAKLTWNAVAKAIPMVFSTEERYYDEAIHELKDEPENDIDPSVKYNIEYIYPVLFTSNTHPREVAVKGKVKLFE